MSSVFFINKGSKKATHQPTEYKTELDVSYNLFVFFNFCYIVNMVQKWFAEGVKKSNVETHETTVA